MTQYVQYRGAVYRLANTIPTIKKPLVWHVGTMDPSSKGSDSLEGAGLSVSEHPEEWTQIAQLGGLPIWELAKPTGVFLNALKLTKKQRQTIVDWGLAHGYVTPVSIYRLYSTDEYGELQYMEFTSREEAERELVDEEDESNYIKEIKGKGRGIGTDKLVQRTHHAKASREPLVVFDLLLTCWVEDETNLDGVWWNERLDPMALSAPRGVIVPSKVAAWTVVETNE